MRTRTALVVAFMFCLAAFGKADTTYRIAVNTSSIAGTAGSLDFNLNPGPLGSPLVSVDLMNFNSNGSFGTAAPSLIGDVSGGPLPTTITFDNGASLNDYFTGFTYGSTLDFEVKFFGSGIATPGGTSLSGSTFSFSMFSDPWGSQPVLTTDTINGFATTINVNLDGSTSSTTSSSETTMSPVPEYPRPFYGVLSGMVVLGVLYWKRSEKQRA